MKERLKVAIEKYFRPEFLNRLDDVIVFHALNKENLKHDRRHRARQGPRPPGDRGLELVLSDEAKDFLIIKGYNPDYGARPLRRAIENLIEDPLAEELLRGTFQGKDSGLRRGRGRGGREPPVQVHPHGQGRARETARPGRRRRPRILGGRRQERLSPIAGFIANRNALARAGTSRPGPFPFPFPALAHADLRGPVRGITLTSGVARSRESIQDARFKIQVTNKVCFIVFIIFES